MIRFNVISKILRHLLLAVGCTAIAAGLMAQEGFPLDGTWRGQWSDPADDSGTIVVVMKWDGERVNGLINPGPNSMDLSVAELDPSNWGVRLEGRGADGRQIAFSGTLTDIGSYNRRIVGTWSDDAATGELELIRE